MSHSQKIVNLLSTALLVGAIAATPNETFAQAANPCVPKAANPCAPKAANPCPASLCPSKKSKCKYVNPRAIPVINLLTP